MPVPRTTNASGASNAECAVNIAGAENLIHPGRSHFDHRDVRAAADADPLG
jgi:hypothetical protein